MEPERVLELELAAVDEISVNELDELDIFDFDYIPPTQSLGLMDKNREELSSQYTEPINLNIQFDSQLLNSRNDITKDPMDSSSVLITTQDIEQVNIDISSDSNFSPVKEYEITENDQQKYSNSDTSKKPCHPSSQGSLNLSSRCQMETTFDKEFANFDEMDFELPIFDEETLAKLDIEIENSRKNEIKSNTQLLTEKHTSINPKNLSCPNFSAAPRSPPTNSRAAAKNFIYSPPTTSRAAAKNLSYTSNSPPTTSRAAAKNLSFASRSPPTSWAASKNITTSSYSPPTTSRAAAKSFTSVSCNPSITSHILNYSGANINNDSISGASIIASQDSIRQLSECIEEISQAMVEKLLKENQNSTTDPSAIPEAVKQLYDLMKPHYSDFSFVYAISSQLCQDHMPMDCFVNIKMALLLSIASINVIRFETRPVKFRLRLIRKNSNIAPIPIVVMSNDSHMANTLINNIADLADRFLGPVDETKPPSSDGFCNRQWIEADPIQLAQGGVFYVGEWSCIKSKRSEELLKCIELSRVFVERTPRIYPLQTAIWVHWFAIDSKPKDRKTFNKFVKIFGIPVFMDNNNNMEALVDFILKQESIDGNESTIDHLSISADEMRQFLAVISKRTVDFTTAATDLLQKYFVASRHERPECLTLQSFTILKQFSESFAKLSLRHEVLTIDVIGAIFLCEHFLQQCYGPGMDPPPVLEPVSFVGDVDAFIVRFHEWLESYVDSYSNIKK